MTSDLFSNKARSVVLSLVLIPLNEKMYKKIQLEQKFISNPMSRLKIKSQHLPCTLELVGTEP